MALARVARSPKAEAFTGADLQAVVDTAQLAAIHSYLEVKFCFCSCDELGGFCFCSRRDSLRSRGKNNHLHCQFDWKMVCWCARSFAD